MYAITSGKFINYEKSTGSSFVINKKIMNDRLINIMNDIKLKFKPFDELIMDNELISKLKEIKLVEIIEYEEYICVFLDDIIYRYTKPRYVDFDFYNLVKKLIENNIYEFRINSKYCGINTGTHEKIEALKSFYEIDEIIHNCYYKITIQTDEQFKKWNNNLLRFRRSEKLKRIIHDND